VYPYFVSIGEGTSIAGQNFILTHTKPLKYHSEVSDAYVAPVIIEKNVWVAINVVVLPGVTIGEGSIVASGSVVTETIPPMVFAAGIPAKVKKDISEKLKKNYTKEEFELLLKRRKEEFGWKEES
jgi:acetyltransferase-like isoleucine patch superfamily enzyme